MKKFLSVLAAILILSSCSKKSDLVEIPMEATFANNFFKDAHLSVTFIELSTVSGKVKVDFGTAYEKGITNIELLAGDSPNYLCVISTSTNSADSYQLKSYSVVDTAPKARIMYYALRYTLPNGDMVYSNTFKFQLGN